MNLLLLVINIFFSIATYLCTFYMIPTLKDMFLAANVSGKDMCKPFGKCIPEAFGVVTGTIYLMFLFFLIPLAFGHYIFDNTNKFPYHEFVELLAAMLSISCMLLLGFADDVLNLKWKYKLLLPTMASVPLLIVYYTNFNSTVIAIPRQFHFLMHAYVDLGILYYVYMGMLAVFCTNAINILAGINGLEVGQCVIISSSILVYNFLEYQSDPVAHGLSVYLLSPYLASSLALMYYNWYPAEVFVGDTFCYFSGMLFAVIGILGHFSKTMLLFFIPQVFNFIFSLPQLFHIIPCPRHRLPKYNKELDHLEASLAECKTEEISVLGWIILKLFNTMCFIHIEKKKDEKSVFYCTNFTLLNLLLNLFGPKHEKKLAILLLCIQILCSILAFGIRYPLAKLLYN